MLIRGQSEPAPAGKTCSFAEHSAGWCGPLTMCVERLVWSKSSVPFGCAPCKGGAFQWVQAPSGKLLQPETTGATMEVTKWLKPSGKERHDIW